MTSLVLVGLHLGFSGCACPKIGRPVPEAEGREDVRELIYQGYRIIYLTRPEKVFIVTVIHGSRDLAGEEVKPWDVV